MGQIKLKCGHDNIDLKCKDCKAFYKSWDKKLEDSGFEDAEKLSDSQTFLKKQTSFIAKRKGNDEFGEEREDEFFETIGESNQLVFENHRRYHEIISEKMHTEIFGNEKDSQVMALTRDGFNVLEISRKLKEQKLTSDRHSILFTIRRYENKWGIKQWKPEQMKRRPWKKAPTRS